MGTTSEEPDWFSLSVARELPCREADFSCERPLLFAQRIQVFSVGFEQK